MDNYWTNIGKIANSDKFGENYWLFLDKNNDIEKKHIKSYPNRERKQ